MGLVMCRILWPSNSVPLSGDHKFKEISRGQNPSAGVNKPLELSTEKQTPDPQELFFMA